MPLFLVFVGLVVIVAAVRNTLGALTTQLGSDLTATQGGVSFLAWFAAILAIGLIGYVPQLQLISRGLLGLVVLAIFLKSGSGFFSQLQQQLSAAPSPSAVPPAVPSNLPAIPIQSTTSGTATQSGITGMAKQIPIVGGLIP